MFDEISNGNVGKGLLIPRPEFGRLGNIGKDWWAGHAQLPPTHSEATAGHSLLFHLVGTQAIQVTSSSFKNVLPCQGCPVRCRSITHSTMMLHTPDTKDLCSIGESCNRQPAKKIATETAVFDTFANVYDYFTTDITITSNHCRCRRHRCATITVYAASNPAWSASLPERTSYTREQ